MTVAIRAVRSWTDFARQMVAVSLFRFAADIIAIAEGILPDHRR